jgi:UDP-glucose 4-epimerase
VAGVLPHLRIFGNDYDTVDGTGVRDYIHVLDLVDAHIIALDRILNNKNENNFEVFNLGTGKGLSVLEMVKLFEKATGEKVPYKFYPRRAGDFASVYNDAQLAKEKLAWQTKLSIKEALADGWNWEKKLRNIK